MTALAQPRSWHARLLAAPAPRRRRLPSDVVGALLGAAVAAAGWLAVAEGSGAPVAPHLGPGVSWLVTLVAVGGTSVYLGAVVLVCALAGRWLEPDWAGPGRAGADKAGAGATGRDHRARESSGSPEHQGSQPPVYSMKIS